MSLFQEKITHPQKKLVRNKKLQSDWQLFCVPMVNRETSLQIEASKNTFACKDTEKERVFLS